MTYRDLVKKLGTATANRVLAIWRSYGDGDLDHDEAVDLIALSIATANERATTLADLAVAATLTTATASVVLPQGQSRPGSDLDRLTKAAATLLTVQDVTEARLERLGRSEPLEAAQQARGRALADSDVVTGWTRDTGADPCELCTWWARDGQVWPTDHDMPTHKGCTCSQTPITREEAS